MPPAGPDLRGALLGEAVVLASPLGALQLGVLDAAYPGVAEAVSGLLVRSITDARASIGGHLPDWLVEDIKRNYIAPAKVRTLWAPTGHRFGLLRGRELVGTVHVAREHDTIFTIDRERINVSARLHPDFKPDRQHHVVNLSVKHELRRARLATAMFDGIIAHFRELFDGDGLWVRADPPWHAGLVGLGFEHDPSMDVFLPPEVARTADLPHAEFNRLHACACLHPSPQRPAALAARPLAMREGKLQYVSFSRPFEPARSLSHPMPGSTPPTALLPVSPVTPVTPVTPGTPGTPGTPVTPVTSDDLARDDATLDRHASDWGGTLHRRPHAVAYPADTDAVVALVRQAHARRTPLVVRGRGHSAGGQSLTDGGLLLSTERLDRILAISPTEVRVEAGITWQALVHELAPRGLYPPVLTGWLPATVGGTLATGGYSKGSLHHGLQVDHVTALVVVTGDGRRVACSASQAAWLFEAALGGLGQFGVIVEATLALVALPPRYVPPSRPPRTTPAPTT
ncbi:MAG: FAD-binding oxidoreductase [Polyangiaceae bacterium]|nr:FAD-binding oxidoreductase [Polyangiaceae bacterium]